MSPPAFFKVFIAEFCDKDLEIPLSFTQSLNRPLPDKVQLRDRHDKEWTVSVGRIGGRWHFLDGWVKFSTENSLVTGDILAFEYCLDTSFYVVIFGTTSTEKNIMPFSVADNQIELDDNAPALDMGSDCDEDYEQVNADGGSRNANQINEKRDCYGFEIFQAGLAPQPRNPYFVTKVMQKRKADLFVPMDLIKDFNLRLGKEIQLVDPKGREFLGKCRTWKDGRVVISGGWRSLCRMNLVIEDDKCICEFVQGEKNKSLFVKVSFVRAM